MDLQPNHRTSSKRATAFELIETVKDIPPLVIKKALLLITTTYSKCSKCSKNNRSNEEAGQPNFCRLLTDIHEDDSIPKSRNTNQSLCCMKKQREKSQEKPLVTSEDSTNGQNSDTEQHFHRPNKASHKKIEKKRARQKLAEKKNTDCQKLIKMQLLQVDLTGKLYASIEKVFTKIGIPVESNYHLYLQDDRDLPKAMLLDNIAGFMNALTTYFKAGGGKLVLQKDEKSLQQWKNAIKTFKRKKDAQKLQLDLKILDHVIKCLSGTSQDCENVPDDLVYELLDSEETEDSENLGVSQHRLLDLNNQAQDLALKIDKNIQKFMHLGLGSIVLQKTPLLSLNDKGFDSN